MSAKPILICAPTEELRSQLETQLGSAGYTTTTVTTPAAAVAALRDGSFDLVLADGGHVSDRRTLQRTAESLGAELVIAEVADPVPNLRHDPLRLAATYRRLMT